MTQQHAATPGLSRKLFKISLPVLVLTIAGLVAWQITASSPRAHRRAPEAQPRLVEVQPVTREDIRVTISGLGTVIASRKLTLYPEVSGQIRQLRDNLLPGSQVRQGETLVRIDVAEYEIQRQKQQAEVALAEAELQKERGQQAIARQEYELIGRTLSPAQEALVLRQPELASAKARLVQAEAALAQATLALERTRIKAPFNAQVTQRSVETGSQVSTGSALLDIVATDEFWLELEVPVEQLRWLEFGEQGSPVTLTSPGWQKGERTGRLLSLSPELNSGSRMAKVMVAIDDPLALKPENKAAPKVLLNDLVRAEIAGKAVKLAVVIPDAQIHNGNQVWLYRQDQTLEIRTIIPIYRDASKAIVAEGLSSHDRLVVSALTAPVDGMALRTENTRQPDNPDEQKKRVANKERVADRGEH